MFSLAEDPRSDPLRWVDAYTVYLDSVAAAMSDTALRLQVEDALKKARADRALALEGTEAYTTADGLVKNQETILTQMQGFDIEAYRSSVALWRSVRQTVLNSGIVLLQPVSVFTPGWTTKLTAAKLTVLMTGSPGMERVKKLTDAGTVVVVQAPNTLVPFRHDEAGVVMGFFSFVDRNRETFDPLAYTKQQLEKQGITAFNFEQHRDRLAIDNPWAPGSTTTIKPRIITDLKD